MQEINSVKPNGFNVVSTFSGGGGSCLGYKMAGFDVVWANEFIPQAQETYRANHKNTILNTKNIREITPADILRECNMQIGDIDIFDGSPPCASFSRAGAGSRLWGKQKKYSSTKERTDDLFFEYARILKGLQPKVFIAENVAGLVIGKAKGYFKIILKELKSCGYTVEARILNAKYLGVPQNRERLIFIGVRNDLNLPPIYPKPINNSYVLGDALSGIENDAEAAQLEKLCAKYAVAKTLQKIPKNPLKKITGNTIRGKNTAFNLVRESMYQPCSTVCQNASNLSSFGIRHPLYDRTFTIRELKRIMSVPDDFLLTGNHEEQYERLGRMVPPVMMMYISQAVAEGILCKMR
jgi:DNA (cytosine-5)-methyltransferase 1